MRRKFVAVVLLISIGLFLWSCDDDKEITIIAVSTNTLSSFAIKSDGSLWACAY